MHGCHTLPSRGHADHATPAGSAALAGWGSIPISCTTGRQRSHSCGWSCALPTASLKFQHRWHLRPCALATPTVTVPLLNHGRGWHTFYAVLVDNHHMPLMPMVMTSERLFVK